MKIDQYDGEKRYYFLSYHPDHLVMSSTGTIDVHNKYIIFSAVCTVIEQQYLLVNMYFIALFVLHICSFFSTAVIPLLFTPQCSDRHTRTEVTSNV